MVIGKGLIASLFMTSDDELNSKVVFFASGVSNSLEERTESFIREENLLRETISKFSDKIFVYFSTCSIYDKSKKNSKYVLHKLEMEKIVKSSGLKFLILRVSNATGRGGNPNLLMNYIINSIKKGDVLDIHAKATRNIIDVEDVKNITEYLLNRNILNRIINVGYCENYKITEIITIIENFYKIQAKVNIIQAGTSYLINTKKLDEYFIEKKMNDKKKYMENILKKYYL